jgi:hypothetical protein
VVATNPQLDVLFQLLEAPASNGPACPQQTQGVPGKGAKGKGAKTTKGLGVETPKGGPDGGRPVPQAGGPKAGEGK